MSDITNVHFDLDDPSWTQATLPVKFDGLGIRSAEQLAPSAYLASVAAASDLSKLIIPVHVIDSVSTPFVQDTLRLWSKNHNSSLPEGRDSKVQRNWDHIVASAVAGTLLEQAPDATSRARLFVSTIKGSEAWLNALPKSALGLRMDNNIIRIVMGLRLGSPLCRTHICKHCETTVDQFTTHGLSCQYSKGRHFGHAINDTIHRTLSSAHIPSCLEPTALFHSDDKHVDGVTQVP